MQQKDPSTTSHRSAQKMFHNCSGFFSLPGKTFSKHHRKVWISWDRPLEMSPYDTDGKKHSPGPGPVMLLGRKKAVCSLQKAGRTKWHALPLALVGPKQRTWLGKAALRWNRTGL